MIPLEKSLPPPQVHARLRAAHAMRRAGERALAFYLREVNDRGLYREEGFADVFHYSRVVADLSVKTTRDLLRVGEALENLPRLAEGYSSGEIPWSKVRELVRVTLPLNEDAWIEATRPLSCRAVEDLVARAQPGDSPQQARRRRAGEGMGRESVPFVLHLRPEVHALLTEALEACRRRTNGGSLEEAVAALAQAVFANEEDERLGSPGGTEEAGEAEEGPNALFRTDERPSYQVVLYRCEACGGARVQPGDLPAPKTLVERSECDAEVVHLEEGGRLSRTIPARVRRAVMLRDRGRCQVPGCTNRLWTDCHHVVWRSEGGEDTVENILVTCSLHHGAIHEGLLRVEREGRGWRWRHGDGREFGVSHVGSPEAEGVGEGGRGVSSHVGSPTVDGVRVDRGRVSSHVGSPAAAWVGAKGGARSSYARSRFQHPRPVRRDAHDAEVKALLAEIEAAAAAATAGFR